MSNDRILILTGGTGTVKVIKGFNKVIPDYLDIITNTGDDFYYYGVKVSPDTDALIYALTEQLDDTKMWGIKGDTFVTQSILRTIDEAEDPVATWFNLGDKDLAYCLYRSYLLKSGKSLSDAIDQVKTNLAIKPKIFPMSDSDVTTYFTITDGKKYHFEEFFIRLHSQQSIKEIEFVNLENASVSHELIERIKGAKLVIIGPSNPVTSIGPILAIKDISNAIKNNKAKKIIISPIIGREAYSGPAKTYMEAKGIDVSPFGIFSIYQELGDDFYFHKTDEKEFGQELSKKAHLLNKNIFFDDIIFNTEQKQINFAKKLIKKYEIKN